MSSPGDLVLYEVENGVAYVTLNRPEARNALTFAMYERVEQLCDDVNRDDGVRVMVLRGAGGHFAAGTDISQFRTFSTGEDAVSYERQQDRVMAHIESVAKPAIAAIEGVAAGGGAMMAVSCDLRIMARSARIGIPVARTLGNCLSIRNAQRLVSLMGPANAKKLIFSAALLTADEALQAGLATDVVDDATFAVSVKEMAERIAQHAPITLRVTKEQARRIQARQLIAEDAADDLVIETYMSNDFHEGVRSFLEKRPARWTGH